MSVDCGLQGTDTFIQRLEDMGRKANAVMESALNDASGPILADAKNTTAFKDKSGDLRRSLMKSNVKSRKGGKYIWIGDVDRVCPYSWYVEYGNSKATAKPFLRPAYYKNKEQAKDIIKSRLQEALK
ncbi:MAG: HK97-gp10 family putative phage morphogenesis protein [Cellulosilyticaceae bacterium]